MKFMPQAFTFAQRNGYPGSFEDYLVFNYQMYCETCKRNEIEPMVFETWKAFAA